MSAGSLIARFGSKLDAQDERLQAKSDAQAARFDARFDALIAVQIDKFAAIGEKFASQRRTLVVEIGLLGLGVAALRLLEVLGWF